jgi:hypothetical protein
MACIDSNPFPVRILSRVKFLTNAATLSAFHTDFYDQTLCLLHLASSTRSGDSHLTTFTVQTRHTNHIIVLMSVRPESMGISANLAKKRADQYDKVLEGRVCDWMGAVLSVMIRETFRIGQIVSVC